MDASQILLVNLEKLHTTKMGAERIKRNLNLETSDVVLWCKQQIANSNCVITHQGKNYYCKIANYMITVNAYSYTIITAHKSKQSK